MNRRHRDGGAGAGVPSTGQRYAFNSLSPSSAARRNRRLAYACERQDQLLKPARPWSPAKPAAHRRWPSGNPRLSAFCRSAPAVRFMAFAIRFTGDFLRECVFNSRTSALDQARRLTRLARLLAICPSPAAVAAMLPSIAERMQDEKQPGSAVEALYAWPWFAAMCTPRADQAVAPSACFRRGLIGAKPQRCLLNWQPCSVRQIEFCNNSEEGLRQARA